ncbi:MAG TPA: copper resistance CopC family protein [Acidobacteriaceae bacterium]|jgi:methionine-rich copper-binding protein CopC|nr:copper resistance CopC family protein [Acidobacteriaceae bacterium]
MNNTLVMRGNGGFRQRASVLALAIALLILLPRAAFAHAVLVKSSPAQGATVKAGDVDITLTYNSRIDALHSSLQLVGSDGKAHTLAVDAHAAPNLLAAKATALAAGAYKVEWQVMATDGHITRGVVMFRAG